MGLKNNKSVYIRRWRYYKKLNTIAGAEVPPPSPKIDPVLGSESVSRLQVRESFPRDSKRRGNKPSYISY